MSNQAPVRDLAWYQMAYPKACDAIDNQRAEVRALIVENERLRAEVASLRAQPRVAVLPVSEGDEAIVEGLMRRAGVDQRPGEPIAQPRVHPMAWRYLQALAKERATEDDRDDALMVTWLATAAHDEWWTAGCPLLATDADATTPTVEPK